MIIRMASGQKLNIFPRFTNFSEEASVGATQCIGDGNWLIKEIVLADKEFC